jgi:hypothetical protein
LLEGRTQLKPPPNSAFLRVTGGRPGSDLRPRAPASPAPLGFVVDAAQADAGRSHAVLELLIVTRHKLPLM